MINGKSHPLHAFFAEHCFADKSYINLHGAVATTLISFSRELCNETHTSQLKDPPGEERHKYYVKPPHVLTESIIIELCIKWY